VSHRESSSSQEIRLCKTMLRGHLPEAFMLDLVKPPWRQHRGRSLPVPAICPNICRVLSSQHARIEQCPTCAPAAILGKHGLLHDHCLKLRHRRIPVEREVADPEPTNAPGEEDTSEEEDTRVKEGPYGAEDDENVYRRASK
jgi:hypothetical protein